MIDLNQTKQYLEEMERTFNTWKRIVYNSLNNNYHKQNKIIVCARWRMSFENFLNDMGIRPEGHKIARLDQTKGFNPKNCEWQKLPDDFKEQQSKRMKAYWKKRFSNERVKLKNGSRKTRKHRT